MMILLLLGMSLLQNGSIAKFLLGYQHIFSPESEPTESQLVHLKNGMKKTGVYQVYNF